MCSSDLIFPRENEPDLDELPPETRAAMEFIPADTIEEVFAAAFDGKRRSRARSAQPAEKLAASSRQTASAAEQRSKNSRLPRNTNV